MWRIIGTTAKGHAWYSRSITFTEEREAIDAADSLNIMRNEYLVRPAGTIQDGYRFFVVSASEWKAYWKRKFGSKTLIVLPPNPT